jgi:hypothetical protein
VNPHCRQRRKSPTLRPGTRSLEANSVSRPEISAQRIAWFDYVNEPARDILARLEGKDERQGGGERKAATFLRVALQDGQRMAAEVIAEGEAAGLNECALRRALKKLGGWSEKANMKTGWIWELPEQAS